MGSILEVNILSMKELTFNQPIEIEIVLVIFALSMGPAGVFQRQGLPFPESNMCRLQIVK